MWLEAMILRRAEAKLRPYRLKAGLVKQDQAAEFEVYLPRIRSCYERALYWHGTGRYHYQYDGESRYDRVNTDALLDVLGSILTQGGLTPHHDPWIPSGGNTVSLGTVRMHSRLFARIHQYEKTPLFFELGSAQYWVRLYFTFILLWSCLNLRSTRQFAKSFFRRTSYRDMQTWASAIRKPEGGKVIGIWDLVSGNVTGSDIETNYPILIGVAKGTLKVMDTIPLTHAVEVRTLKPVTLNDFTHLEVPLSSVAETEALLKSRGVTLPVMPLEFVDLYLSEKPLKELAYS